MKKAKKMVNRLNYLLAQNERIEYWGEIYTENIEEIDKILNTIDMHLPNNIDCKWSGPDDNFFFLQKLGMEVVQ